MKSFVIGILVFILLIVGSAIMLSSMTPEVTQTMVTQDVSLPSAPVAPLTSDSEAASAPAITPLQQTVTPIQQEE